MLCCVLSRAHLCIVLFQWDSGGTHRNTQRVSICLWSSTAFRNKRKRCTKLKTYPGKKNQHIWCSVVVGGHFWFPSAKNGNKNLHLILLKWFWNPKHLLGSQMQAGVSPAIRAAETPTEPSETRPGFYRKLRLEDDSTSQTPLSMFSMQFSCADRHCLDSVLLPKNPMLQSKLASTARKHWFPE